jgi:NAD(P)H dehydrogenase (quinone)
MRIAVTGSTGTIGRQVARILSASGEHDVVGLARTPTRATSSSTRYADYADLPSLRTALNGVHTLVFVSSDGEAANMVIHHQNVVQAAAECGVAHVVYLSGVDADLSSPFCYAFTNGYTEQLIAGSGCGFSVARASIYTEFFMRFAKDARRTGAIRLPAAHGRVSLVSREDVGRSLAALAVAPQSGRHHDITGAESLDIAALAEVLGHTWRIPVGYVAIEPAEFASQLAHGGEDPWWAYAFTTMFASIREQRWSATSDEVVQLTGRMPLSVADVAARSVVI